LFTLTALIVHRRYAEGPLITSTKESDGDDMMMMDSLESDGAFTILHLEVFGVGDVASQDKAMAGRGEARMMEANRIQQARKVDKMQFYDDFKSGMFESKAFGHQEQTDDGRR